MGILVALVAWGIHHRESLGYTSIALLIVYVLVIPLICNHYASMNQKEERIKIKEKIR